MRELHGSVGRQVASLVRSCANRRIPAAKRSVHQGNQFCRYLWENLCRIGASGKSSRFLHRYNSTHLIESFAISIQGQEAARSRA